MKTTRNPKMRTYLFNLCISALCVALIAVCSFISIPVANLKFTLQLLAVLFTAGILPPVWCGGTLTAYMLLGIIGVPVFAGFNAGIASVAGPTGGYILGFLPTALCASIWLHFIKRRTFFKIAGIFAAATLLCYICGLFGFYIYMPEKGFAYALTATLLPYLPFDALKILLAASLSCKLYPFYLRFTKASN